MACSFDTRSTVFGNGLRRTSWIDCDHDRFSSVDSDFHSGRTKSDCCGCDTSVWRPSHTVRFPTGRRSQANQNPDSVPLEFHLQPRDRLSLVLPLSARRLEWLGELRRQAGLFARRNRPSPRIRIQRRTRWHISSYSGWSRSATEPIQPHSVLRLSRMPLRHRMSSKRYSGR